MDQLFPGTRLRSNLSLSSLDPPGPPSANSSYNDLAALQGSSHALSQPHRPAFSLDPTSSLGPAFPHTVSHHRHQNSITEEDIFSTLGGLDLGSEHSHGPEHQHSPGTVVNRSTASPPGGGGSNQRLDYLGSNPNLNTHHIVDSNSSQNLSSHSNSGLNLSAMGSGGSLSAFPQSQPEPSRTLFVRNVALSVGDEELHMLMSRFGDVRQLHTSAKARGYVTITYFDLRAAMAAKESLNGSLLHHMALEAHFTAPKSQERGVVDQDTVIMYNLDPNATNDNLFWLFSKYGDVCKIREAPDRRSQKIITFYDIRHAHIATQAMNKAEEHGGLTGHPLPASNSQGEMAVAGFPSSQAQLLELAAHLHNDPASLATFAASSGWDAAAMDSLLQLVRPQGQAQQQQQQQLSQQQRQSHGSRSQHCISSGQMSSSIGSPLGGSLPSASMAMGQRFLSNDMQQYAPPAQQFQGQFVEDQHPNAIAIQRGMQVSDSASSIASSQQHKAAMTGQQQQQHYGGAGGSIGLPPLSQTHHHQQGYNMPIPPRAGGPGSGQVNPPIYQASTSPSIQSGIHHLQQQQQQQSFNQGSMHAHMHSSAGHHGHSSHAQHSKLSPLDEGRQVTDCPEQGPGDQHQQLQQQLLLQQQQQFRTGQVNSIFQSANALRGGEDGAAAAAAANSSAAAVAAATQQMMLSQTGPYNQADAAAAMLLQMQLADPTGQALMQQLMWEAQLGANAGGSNADMLEMAVAAAAAAASANSSACPTRNNSHMSLSAGMGMSGNSRAGSSQNLMLHNSQHRNSFTGQPSLTRNMSASAGDMAQHLHHQQQQQQQQQAPYTPSQLINLAHLAALNMGGELQAQQQLQAQAQQQLQVQQLALSNLQAQSGMMLMGGSAANSAQLNAAAVQLLQAAGLGHMSYNTPIPGNGSGGTGNMQMMPDANQQFLAQQMQLQAALAVAAAGAGGSGSMGGLGYPGSNHGSSNNMSQLGRGGGSAAGGGMGYSHGSRGSMGSDLGGRISSSGISGGGGGGRLSRRTADPCAEMERKQQQEKLYALDLAKIARGEDRRTTLMVKNIPNKYTQKMLLSTVDELCRGSYDFFYLPIDFKNKCNVGYAFINMMTPAAIIPLVERFNHRKWDRFNSEKVCHISYARIQGRTALVSHFQNSSLMHEDKRCRPILFTSDGIEVGDPEPFPTSTSNAMYGGSLNSGCTIADGFAGSGSFSGPGGGGGGGSFSSAGGGVGGGVYLPGGGHMVSSSSSNSLRLLQQQQQMHQPLQHPATGRPDHHPLMMDVMRAAAVAAARSSNEWDDTDGGSPTGGSSSEQQQQFFPAGTNEQQQAQQLQQTQLHQQLQQAQLLQQVQMNENSLMPSQPYHLQPAADPGISQV